MPGGYGRERTRNTETFGATSVALSSASRRFGGRGGGGYSSYSVSLDREVVIEGTRPCWGGEGFELSA